MLFDLLRGAVKVDILDRLAPGVNLWLGPNQAGKTARLTAIRLAVLGESGFTAWKELLPPGADEVTASLHRNGQAMAVFRGCPGKRPKQSLPGFRHLDDDAKKYMLPQATLAELVSYGDKRGRRAIIRRWGAGGGVLERPRLTPEEVSMWDEEVAASREDEGALATAVEVLARLHERLHSRALSEGRTIGTLRREVEKQRAGLSADAAGSEQLPLMRQKLVLAQKWEASAVQRTRIGQLEASVTDLKANVEGLEASVEALAADRDSKSAAMEEAAESVKLLSEKVRRGRDWLETVEKAIKNKHPGCPLCGFGDADMHAIWEMVSAASLENGEKYENVVRAVQSAQTATNEAARDWSNRNALLLQKRNDRNKQEAELAGLRAGLAALDAPPSYQGPTAASLVERIRALESAEGARRQLKEREARIGELEKAQERAKGLRDKAQELIDAQMRTLQSAAESDVQEFMPAGLTVSLDLANARWNVVSPKDGRAHAKSACGYEECSLFPAIIQAYAKPTKDRIAVFDDKDLYGFDRQNFIALLVKLDELCKSGAISQVFMANSWLTPDQVPESINTIWVGPTADAPKAALHQPVDRESLGL